MPTTHLAILIQPLLNFVLDGHKTIETRISKIKLPPYQSVAVGDYVLIKESGGPIKGMFEVAKVDTFHSETSLNGNVFDAICETDGQKIFGLPDAAVTYRKVFRKKWCESKYATFMHVKDVRRYTPAVRIQKTNRQAWVVLGDGTAEEWIDRLL